MSRVAEPGTQTTFQERDKSQWHIKVVSPGQWVYFYLGTIKLQKVSKRMRRSSSSHLCSNKIVTIGVTVGFTRPCTAHWVSKSARWRLIGAT